MSDITLRRETVAVLVQFVNLGIGGVAQHMECAGFEPSWVWSVAMALNDAEKALTKDESE